MPSGGRTIIVPGGISDVAPFTIGQIPMVVATGPPSLSDSILRQVVGPPLAIIVGATDPSAAATETFRTQGGIISSLAGSVDSVRIGRGASPAGGAGAIGIGLTATTDSAGNIAIGNLAVATSVGCLGIGSAASATGNNATAVGTGAIAVGGGGAGGATAFGNLANASAIGSTAIGATSSATTNATALGFGALASATGGTAIGNGANVQAGHTNAVCLGISATSISAGSFVCGSNVGLQGIETVLFGRGDTAASPDDLLIRMTDSSGANNPGGDLTIRPSFGTGTGTPGEIIFVTSSTTAAGAALQTGAVRARISNVQLFLDNIRARIARSAVGEPVFQGLVTGDAAPRFQLNASGQMNWGDGTVIDTVLYRGAANRLATNDDFDLNGTNLLRSATQVVTARQTGWGAPTGTATRTTFATATVTLPQLAERVKALIDDLTTHGLIGA